MYQDYILKADITSRINSTNLEELTNSTDAVWEDIEKGTLEHIAGYTRHWYDMDKEFRAITTHVDTVTYSEDDRVILSNVLYIAIQDVPTGIAVTNVDYWEAKDDRNQVLKRIAVDIILYDLAGRNNSRSAPEYRFDRNKNANDDLVKIQKGIIMLDIPTLTFEDDEEEEEYEGQRVVFGNTNQDGRDDY